MGNAELFEPRHAAASLLAAHAAGVDVHERDMILSAQHVCAQPRKGCMRRGRIADRDRHEQALCLFALVLQV